MRFKPVTKVGSVVNEAIWDDDAIAKIRALWAAGHPTAEIGKRMGISKNAVIGKARRLDLPARPSPIKRGGVVKVTRRIRAPSIALPTAQNAVEGGQSRQLVFSGRTMADLPSAPSVTFKSRRGRSETQRASETQLNRLQFQSTKKGYARSEIAAHFDDDRLVYGFVDIVEQAQHSSVSVPLDGVTFKPRRSSPCCWPIGEPGDSDYHECGAVSRPGKPYCVSHCASAYKNAATDTRRDEIAAVSPDRAVAYADR